MDQKIVKVATATKHKAAKKGLGWGGFNGYSYVCLVSNSKLAIKKLLEAKGYTAKDEVTVRPSKKNYQFYIQDGLDFKYKTFKYQVVFLNYKNADFSGVGYESNK